MNYENVLVNLPVANEKITYYKKFPGYGFKTNSRVNKDY